MFYCANVTFVEKHEKRKLMCCFNSNISAEKRKLSQFNGDSATVKLLLPPHFIGYSEYLTFFNLILNILFLALFDHVEHTTRTQTRLSNSVTFFLRSRISRLLCVLATCMESL